MRWKKSLVALLICILTFFDSSINMLMFLNQSNLQVENMVLEGFFTLNKSQMVTLQVLLMQKLNEGNNLIMLKKGQMRIAKNDSKVVVQLISDDYKTIYVWHNFWQKYSLLVGNKQQIGLSVISKAYKNIEVNNVLNDVLCIDNDEVLSYNYCNNFYEAVGFKKSLGKALVIDKQKINWNLVCKNDRVYVGFPIIYQTY